MKRLGTYTARGQVLEGQEQKVILFDGRFDTGYRVTGFLIWGGDISSSSNDCAARLATERIGNMPSSGDMMDARDSRQIAWAGIQAGTAGFNNPAGIVDFDNLVIEDLYISGQSGGSSIPINYLITMEKYEISEWRGALGMVRNSAQDV